MRWLTTFAAGAALYGCGTIISTNGDVAGPADAAADAPVGSSNDGATEGGGTDADSGDALSDGGTDASTDKSDAADADAPKDAAAEASDGGCASPTTTITLTAVQDTMLGACNTNTYGTDDAVRIGIPGNDPAFGPGLFQFALSVKQANDLKAPAVIVSATLALAADPTCALCTGGTPAKAGTLTARMMRNDWVEGASGSAGSGTDSCTRNVSKALGWGDSGLPPSGTTQFSSLDYDATASTTTVLDILDSAPNVTIPIKPAAFLSYGFPSSQMASFVVMISSGGRFVAASHQASSHTKPTLTITYCNN